ncbi:pyruvate dehydrogenase E2 component (dihydrolipoamide acetyltransferase) [Granulicatella balaenopterae]|uniref:Dihydrolipoamide acetyltransferase component of pyruvate dehydrogenase complex n=1 Tax=Granulicatella balaenopterae TaxID=137733 RepID=A0A1H9HEG5_9LACT|nr:dihydrolipoamide acetyltransferase family protein [Granulicatella balaenopterae]SEQ60720.1 pyruvate dehydrogenase E2 component (dihydrolipoamide acetyltransferase) [Granulicatella balaenopterae]
MYQFIMPDAGEGTHESEILKWFFKEGDMVQEDEILLEIQSDKAAVELPSPVTGIIRKLHVPEGEMGIVGEPIADIEIEGETAADEKEEATTATTAPSVENTTSNVANPVAVTAEIRQIAVPRVRIYARGKGVDLTQVTGTGNHGKITIEDVDKFLAEGPAPIVKEEVSQVVSDKVAPVSVASEAVVEPVRELATPMTNTESTQQSDRIEKMPAMRKTIAKAMVQSKQISPHVTVFDQVEVEKLVEHRQRMKVIAQEKGIKLTYTAYFIKAIVAMLKRFPELNSSINLAKGEVYYHNYFNIGMATNTDHGLYVPVIRNAERLSLFEIAEQITELSKAAIDNNLKASDMGRGSMTLTNVGGAATGGVWSTPIINQPEVAILGVGRIEEMFVPDEDRNPVLKPILKLSFAFDHRAVDGVTAQKAINTIKEYLNNPDLLLAEG